MTWIDAVIQGILLGGLYALFACGLSLMFGVMRIINLAHGDLALLATFMVLVISQHLGLSPFAALVIVLPGAAVVGYALQYAMFNPSLRGGELSPLLATFGLSVVIGNMLLEVFSPDTHSLSAGALTTASWHITSQISISALSAVIFGVAVLVLGGLQLLLSYTQLGRAMRATADDARTAELVGINAKRVYAIATAIALATAALAGTFFGMRSSFDPTLGPSQLIFAFEAVVIGGLGSLWGTLVGGILLGVAQTVGAQAFGAEWAIVSGNVLFLLVLAFRSQGIFAAREAHQ
ncbi:MAG: branched-chain amino acid ABC transporter permease [Solirubrobacterales bacterium]|nr:branched-chain amino acid ABC transporter permease [Solirubrobacterales bacterium]MBV9796752.1 branched-chain amino acid ABC transporter permease [Solirubrobacterales bacterium]